ncbi:hypothetical protein A3F64_02705 [Candidatus Saccharibacteria bacterium RIFCSPHIGHO2_12_FULL_42_8]|nr:MAG: hypothetical protein A3F64_02705 [Candidatus Saccharibacteria bacterium RIFCSPHIGHO2_12_FULL_42_8]
MTAALKLAEDLRSEGSRVEVDISLKKAEKQIKTALKKDIPYLLFIGEEEIKSRLYTLKNTASSKEEKLSFERIVSIVKDQRN